MKKNTLKKIGVTAWIISTVIALGLMIVAIKLLFFTKQLV